MMGSRGLYKPENPKTELYAAMAMTTGQDYWYFSSLSMLAVSSQRSLSRFQYNHCAERTAAAKRLVPGALEKPSKLVLQLNLCDDIHTKNLASCSFHK